LLHGAVDLLHFISNHLFIMPVIKIVIHDDSPSRLRLTLAADWGHPESQQEQGSHCQRGREGGGQRERGRQGYAYNQYKNWFHSWSAFLICLLSVQ
jgi:hypothetical protein